MVDGFVFRGYYDELFVSVAWGGSLAELPGCVFVFTAVVLVVTLVFFWVWDVGRVGVGLEFYDFGRYLAAAVVCVMGVYLGGIPCGLVLQWFFHFLSYGGRELVVSSFIFVPRGGSVAVVVGEVGQVVSAVRVDVGEMVFIVRELRPVPDRSYHVVRSDPVIVPVRPVRIIRLLTSMLTLLMFTVV